MKNVFEAIATRDAGQVIAVIDPAFKEAALEASERANGNDIRIAGGRAPAAKSPEVS